MKLNKHKLLLQGLLIMSFIIVLLVNFIYNDIPQIFWFGFQLGQVSSNLALAYISSYIFYLVLVLPKEHADKRNINSLAFEITSRLVSRGYSIYWTLIEVTRTPEDKFNRRNINFEQYAELCAKCERFHVIPNRYFDDGTPATAATLIYNNTIDHVAASGELIKDFLPLLDSEYISRFYAVLDSHYFQFSCKRIIDRRCTNETFQGWEMMMFKYLVAIRELDIYNESKLKRYKRRPL